MSLQPLIWTDFAPDLDSITPGACQDMSNVYPVQSGFYRTLPGLQLVGQGLGSMVYGSLSGLLIDMQATFAATSNQLWIWRNGIFQSSGAALISNTNRRRFAIYGNLVIVVDGVNVPYYYSAGFPALAFQPVPNWPGNFGTVQPSIVETTDYATILVQANSQVLWSSLNPTGPYIPSVPAQVYQYVLGQIPGDITAVHRLRSLLVVYRQNAFQCATFVGVDIGWDFGQPGTISEDIGAAGNECVVNTGDYHYIWGPDDFWQFDGYNLNRIPNNLKQFIFRDLDQGFFANVAGRYDVNRTLVFWHYPSINANPKGSLDSYVSLNLRTGKWGFGRLNIDLPLTGLMNDPISEQTTPDSGVFLPDHNLYLYDELAPFAPSPSFTPAPTTGALFLTYAIVESPTVGVESFPLSSNGTAPPLLPDTNIMGATGTGCIVADGQIWTANGSVPAIYAWPVTADGGAAPTTTISGAATQLVDPVDVAVDAAGLIYVADRTLGAILVYAAGADGDVAPIAVISGATTTLVNPQSVAVDSFGNIYVIDNGAASAPSIIKFAAGSNGNVAPSDIITDASSTAVAFSAVRLAANNVIYAADAGGNQAFVFPAGASGSATPTTILTNAVLVAPSAIAVDNAGNIFVLVSPNIYQFAATATGADAPITTLDLTTMNLTVGGIAIATSMPSSAPFVFTPLTYIVSNDFGDRHMVYSTRRLRPGFAQYPVVPNTTPTPVLITPLVQQQLTGTKPVAAFSTPISDDGWGNLKVTARLQRFRLDLFGTCELAQGDVDISATGAV